MADILERAAIEDAEEQRAEVGATLPRLGPAADHELLLLVNFQLAPIRGPFARHIFGGGALRNEAFPPAGQRSLMQRATIAGDLFADAQDWRTGFGEKLFKNGAALGERPIAQICLTVTEYVEGDEGDGRVRRVRKANGDVLCRFLSSECVPEGFESLQARHDRSGRRFHHRARQPRDASVPSAPVRRQFPETASSCRCRAATTAGRGCHRHRPRRWPGYRRISARRRARDRRAAHLRATPASAAARTTF